jgi:integrase/recombinase XerD
MSLMIIKAITEVQTNRFEEYLLENEKSAATVKKYLHEIRTLSEFLAGCKLDKLLLLKYRDQLRVKNKARTVNVKISAINAYLEFIGMNECKLKYLKVQRRAFVDEGRELNAARECE